MQITSSEMNRRNSVVMQPSKLHIRNGKKSENDQSIIFDFSQINYIRIHFKWKVSTYTSFESIKMENFWKTRTVL